MWPVQTRVPGVKVQVWNSCSERMPGNFFSRKVFRREMSTFPTVLEIKSTLQIVVQKYLGLFEEESDRSPS